MTAPHLRGATRTSITDQRGACVAGSRAAFLPRPLSCASLHYFGPLTRNTTYRVKQFLYRTPATAIWQPRRSARRICRIAAVEKTRTFHQHWTIATACPGNTRRTMCGIFTTLCVQVRFRTRTPLSNVPTRC